MIYMYGAVALVLLLFIFILLKIALKGKSAYHNIAAVIAISVAPFMGYYIVAFIAELVRSLTNSGAWSP